jgi:hypothetical protein
MTTTPEHNHHTRGDHLKPPGRCPACDAIRASARESLTLTDSEWEPFARAIGVDPVTGDPLINCILCGEPMDGEESASVLQPMHRICALRNVIGGIGHLLDHDHFCTGKRDPDAGLDYRTSALLVEVWIQRKGVEAAVSTPATPPGSCWG